MQQAERSGTVLRLREIDATVVTDEPETKAGRCVLLTGLCEPALVMQSAVSLQPQAASCLVPEGILTPFVGQASGQGALYAIKRNAARLASCKTLALAKKTE